ncbi:MAG: RT0821/Lpp0805 family surface protein [Pseudomonadota bacterium]
MRKIIMVCSVVALLVACAENRRDSVLSQQNIGTVLGGAAGAWAGSNVGGGSGKTIATVVGGLLGAALGNQIGRQLDERDEMLAGNTMYKTLESGPSYRPSSWRNPDTGNYGEVTAQPVRSTQYGENCRDYNQTIFIDGQAETARGTACRRADGTWDIVG